MFRKVFLLTLGLSILCSVFSVDISNIEFQEIGQKIFENECNKKFGYLTHWNQGESFGSFGIGHFIWYPDGGKRIYNEKFPGFLIFLKSNKIRLPDFLQPDKPCPWKTREDFYKNYNSEKMIYLRELLDSTKSLQAKFIVNNFEASIPKIKAAASLAKRQQVEKILNAMLRTEAGLYPLIDYVNFKGDGTRLSERYKGQGWGLLQVLENMKDPNSDSNIVKNFAESAKFVLKQRVENSPNKTEEQKRLPGWLKRIETYKEAKNNKP